MIAANSGFFVYPTLSQHVYSYPFYCLLPLHLVNANIAGNAIWSVTSPDNNGKIIETYTDNTLCGKTKDDIAAYEKENTYVWPDPPGAPIGAGHTETTTTCK